MDRDVGLVVEVDHRHAEARRPRRPRGRCPSRARGRRRETPRASRAARRSPAYALAAALGVARGRATTSSNQARGDGVDDVRQRLGRAGEVEGPLRRREEPADHVHVHAGDELSRELRVAHELGLRARRSREARGSGSCAAAAAASRVGSPAASARATSRIAALPDALSLAPADSWQRCAVSDDLAGGRGPCPGSSRRRRRSVAGTIFARTRARRTILSRGAGARGVLGLPLRDHEREPVLELVRREVPPADQVAVVARPRRRLVRISRRGTPPRRAPRRRAGGRRERPVGENDLAAHVLARVVFGSRAGADVDELRRDVGVLAVVGERDRQVAETRRSMPRASASPLRGCAETGFQPTCDRKCAYFVFPSAGKRSIAASGEPGAERLRAA